MSSYKDLFRKREEERVYEEQQRSLREEAERSKREQEEQSRRQAERDQRIAEEQRYREEDRRKKQPLQEVASHFDADIQLMLEAYGEVKLAGRSFQVEGPEVGYSSVSWSLRCSGYDGVVITLQFKKGWLGSADPTGFTISGTYGGRHSANLSTRDLADAIASSRPTEYNPPSESPWPPPGTCDMGFS